MRKWIDLVEYQTRDGAEITFEFLPNIEEDNRGFIVDQLNALINDEQVGYIKVEYIDPDAYAELMPEGIFSYIHGILGHLILPYRSFGKTVSFEDCTREELARVVTRLPKCNPPSSEPDEVITYLRGPYQKTREFRERFVKRYQDFQAFHFGKPFVSYIQTRQSRRNGNTHDNTRRGIATALYCKMAHILAQRGQRLYASRLQQPEATKAWEMMTARGWTETDERGLYLDASKCPSA